MQFNRKGVICNRIPTLERENLEMISTELTVNKKKWIIFSIYRPPVSSNLKSFFQELSLCMNKALEKYDNVIIMGDINIDWQNRKHQGYDDLKEFCDVFDLDNLVKEATCITSNHSSSIDVILTNRKRYFQHTTVLETGLSDYHSMIATFMSHV